jgi:hypothetical protein
MIFGGNNIFHVSKDGMHISEILRTLFDFISHLSEMVKNKDVQIAVKDVAIGFPAR